MVILPTGPANTDTVSRPNRRSSARLFGWAQQYRLLAWKVSRRLGRERAAKATAGLGLAFMKLPIAWVNRESASSAVVMTSGKSKLESRASNRLATFRRASPGGFENRAAAFRECSLAVVASYLACDGGRTDGLAFVARDIMPFLADIGSAISFGRYAVRCMSISEI